MIAFKIVDGVCIEVRFVPDGFVAGDNETLMEGDSLPSRESLSDPIAWAAYINPKQKTLSDGQLAALLVKKGLLTDADVQQTVSAENAI